MRFRHSCNKVAGIGVLVTEINGNPNSFNCSLRITGVQERCPESPMIVRGIWIQFDGSFEFGNRLFWLPAVLASKAQSETRYRVPLVDFDGPLGQSDGLGNLVGSRTREAEDAYIESACASPA